MNAGNLLLIEDDVRSANSLEHLLRSVGYVVHLCHRGDEGLAEAKGGQYDAVITDLRMPGLGGLELVKHLHAVKPRLPIVLMTAFGTTETAIEATKNGAFDYLVKPFEVEEMLTVVEKAVASARFMSEPVELGDQGSSGDAIVGNSRVMQAVYKEMGRIASRPVTVLICGETGTGKELVARAIFLHSDRALKPFIAINCAAIPENLLESELFGHERGAFTGADSRRIGRFEQAVGGTLFLDEIGDMSPMLQAKLLRVLQEKTIQRVGGKETIPVDVRIIAATHRDLEAAIAAKTFREDLYYRLSATVVKLPPLRDRVEDVPDLVRYFLRRFGVDFELQAPAIEPEAIAWLQQQKWPGNVRQLGNVVRQALLHARGFAIRIDHLLEVMTSSAPNPPNPSEKPNLEEYMNQLLDAAKEGHSQEDIHARVMEAMERELFTRAIKRAGWNQAKASRWLNVSRQTMREKLQQFGLKEPGQGPKAQP